MTATTFHLWTGPERGSATGLFKFSRSGASPDAVVFGEGMRDALNRWDDMMTDKTDVMLVCHDLATDERRAWVTQRGLGPGRVRPLGAEDDVSRSLLPDLHAPHEIADPDPPSGKRKKKAAKPKPVAVATAEAPSPLVQTTLHGCGTATQLEADEPDGLVRVRIWLAAGPEFDLGKSRLQCDSQPPDGASIGRDAEDAVRLWIEDCGLLPVGQGRYVHARGADEVVRSWTVWTEGPGKVRLQAEHFVRSQPTPEPEPPCPEPEPAAEATPKPAKMPIVVPRPVPILIDDPGPPGCGLLEAAQLAAAATNPRDKLERRRLVRLRYDDGDDGRTLVLDAGCGTVEASVRVRPDEAERLRFDAKKGKLPVCLPANRLHDVLSAHPEAEWTGVVDGPNLRLSSARGKYVLPTGDGSAFGAGRERSGKPRARRAVSGLALRKALKLASFATDKDCTRYVLGGVRIEFGPESLSVVTTDGRRLAVYAVGAEGGVGEPIVGELVDADALRWVEKALRNVPARVSIEENRLVVEQAGWSCSCGLLEGGYPEWRKVIDDTHPVVQLPLAAGALVDTVRAAMTFAGEERGIDLTLEAGRLRFGCKSEQGGADVMLPVPDATGDPVFEEIAGRRCRLDHKFLTEGLGRLDPHAEIEFGLRGPDLPASIRVGTEWLYWMMPMSIEDGPAEGGA